MFVETERPLPYGTELEVVVYLPALEQPASVKCTVRWVIAAGMGLQFGPLRVAETWAINLLAKQSQRG